MSQLTSGQITLGKASALLGILQSLAWFVMSLLCIIEYNIKEVPSFSTSNFNLRVYYFYLYKDAVLPPGTIVTPTTFTVFMCIYIVLNTIWMVTSLFQICVLRSQSVNIPVVFKDWALITWAISLVDFILVVLIGADYGEHCKDTFGEEICTNTMIPVLAIVARGFALWFVNVVVAWLNYKNAKILRKGGSYEGTLGGIIPIYRSRRHIPRAAVSTAASLYNQQQHNVNGTKTHWNVNLRTAMDNRTPPTSPRTPYDRNNEFFGRY